MKKIILVTGGAGFIGTNLINHLLKKTNKKIFSLDNYSTGLKKNHIKNKRIKYVYGSTTDIKKIFLKYKKKFIQFFILENLPEYTKALNHLMNVMTLIQLEQKQFLNFV